MLLATTDDRAPLGGGNAAQGACCATCHTHRFRDTPRHEVFRSKVRWVTPLGTETTSIS